MNESENNVSLDGRRVKSIEVQIQRFLGHIEKLGPNDCWLWKAGKDKDGYGKAQFNRRGIRAHRLSWLIINGEIPEGLMVLHNCPGGDNPSCCNPAHLWLGTCLDNNQDRNRKGRTAKGDKSGPRLHRESYTGENNGRCKLTEQQVSEIRNRFADGASRLELVHHFNISKTQLGRILRGETWLRLLNQGVQDTPSSAESFV